ncbi:ATP-dependent zinc metalloprotease FtsH [Dialister micraerophilus]|uniref:ATP-dependent zinc metalloprotease FtsH n=1 Tax=Dialister micraerophilus UPII 345-E TaxID=910314 RepID=E4L7Y9_9FIRM|nr:ATP-dependent zinc metalloprotease FtsH [Dialister micraerophilus]EFR43150.1 ATP-dependent metallopeptidase HflB [Dialister micraerophilus UPII 345-E]MDK8285831.1 ATP-dependent zinc metalloprotease FtsH [Dialister micraerophilus]
MNKFAKNVALYVLIIIVAVSIFNTFVHPQQKHSEIAYSDFISQVDNKNVSSVVMTENSITGKLKDGTVFSTYAPDNDPTLLPKLTKSEVAINVKPPEQPAWWMSLLSSVLPIVILVVVWFWIMNQTQGGGRVMTFGKSKAKMAGEGKIHVTFKDVAGADEAKEELAEVVDFLRNPGRYTDIGAKIPKGVLLVGPPGTGKTLLARAVAGEARVPFFSISGSDFVEMFVGVGASRVRDLFAQAKKNAPCILFIDEIDAVGRQRGSGLGGGHDEREQTLNQLLVEMDGFGINEGIITIAATNRPDILDPALLRPGRFDRRVIVGKPDLRGRVAILKVHARNKPLDKDINLETIAKKVPGFTGADLANLLNEAALLAARTNRKLITMQDLEEASEKVAYGPERRSHKVSEEERRLTAYHESGHAIMATVLKDADPVHKVTIVPRGQAGGYTMMLPHEERSFITKAHLLAKLRVALGGRCAEQIIFNEISSGASGDLQQVTAILRKMVMEWGMSERLGPMIFGEHQEQIFLGKQLGSERNYGEDVASAIDEEMHKYLMDALNDTMRILNENIEVLHAMAKALLEEETINKQQVENLFKYHSIYAPGEEPMPILESDDN